MSNPSQNEAPFDLIGWVVVMAVALLAIVTITLQDPAWDAQLPLHTWAGKHGSVYGEPQKMFPDVHVASGAVTLQRPDGKTYFVNVSAGSIDPN